MLQKQFFNLIQQYGQFSCLVKRNIRPAITRRKSKGPICGGGILHTCNFLFIPRKRVKITRLANKPVITIKKWF